MHKIFLVNIIPNLVDEMSRSGPGYSASVLCISVAFCKCEAKDVRENSTNVTNCAQIEQIAPNS